MSRPPAAGRRRGAGQVAVALYLGMVLILGGASAAGHAANLLLQVLGAVLIGWSGMDAAPASAAEPGRAGVWLLRGMLALVVVQFLPLPPAVWTHLPGREGVAQGFALIGMAPPWLLVSLSPLRSLASLAWAIPALALFIAMRGPLAPRPRTIAGVVVAIAALSACLGMVQWLTGAGYIYTITNYGFGPGFFANSNHQSMFLLMALALGAGLYARARRDGRFAPLRFVAAGIAALLILGVLINRSLACIVLLPIEVAVLSAILWPRWRRPLLFGALPLVAGLGIAATLVLGGSELTGGGVVPGISRREFAATGLRMLRDSFPVGTGLGSFPLLYPWYEDADRVGATFVNHAHNDLIELLIETGVAGAIVLGLFLWWFGASVRRIGALRSGSEIMPRCATVAIGAILLHSLVDYPLRTAALSGFFALCCAIVARPPRHAPHS